ncbi:MAG: class IV adenylate cyclase [Planctomycetes bacterium]|nr:class IV adenylate cyclase [Planctomycetota bacterium]
MAVEIEAKLKVDGLTPVRTQLRTLDARFVSYLDQEDLYWDNAHSQMVTEDKCLRIRVETTEQSTETFITYKGPKQEADVKCREEIEMPVPDCGQARTLLGGLGYEQKLKVHKRRELWFYKACQVCLDQVTDLGTFVEIEGPSSDVIHDVQKYLGLGQVPHCQESYACLLARSQTLNPEP